MLINSYTCTWTPSNASRNTMRLISVVARVEPKLVKGVKVGDSKGVMSVKNFAKFVTVCSEHSHLDMWLAQPDQVELHFTDFDVWLQVQLVMITSSIFSWLQVRFCCREVAAELIPHEKSIKMFIY